MPITLKSIMKISVSGAIKDVKAQQKNGVIDAAIFFYSKIMFLETTFSEPMLIFVSILIPSFPYSSRI